ncbi:DUF2336 domain-containing protein [Maritalea mediterranea]|uniref:DUF2336 domain-containing protein n=1 Tax=Maritalea mediterranea TaxID=2909667 RepID=A0ABS9EBV8_9HYPH|nr:DUF2336 domain-containing protein [Maritalea mediterranea]MCF4098941.1 DUF2336 domain-containing protein [Maritalea mediterranea]
MEIDHSKGTAFSNFRALNHDSSPAECEHLIRNMATLFSHVVDRCDDEQISQYDDVLCQLAELVESEARAEVAKILAPLSRAPGTVVIKLAHDEVEVAAPLLEFSSVLSDDDLIEIIESQTEGHRAAIAGRNPVTDRVSSSICDHAENETIVKLMENENAVIGPEAGPILISRAAKDATIAGKMAHRQDVDWRSIYETLDHASKRVFTQLARTHMKVDQANVEAAKNVVVNKIKEQVGFNAAEWNVAWGQVKALSDRRKLDMSALERFCRFSYAHHTAAAIALMLKIKPDVMVKWFAGQDVGAFTVAARALDMSSQSFAKAIAIVPWREKLGTNDLQLAAARYETLSYHDAREIFEMWRAHSFRRPQQKAHVA